MEALSRFFPIPEPSGDEKAFALGVVTLILFLLLGTLLAHVFSNMFSGIATALNTTMSTVKKYMSDQAIRSNLNRTFGSSTTVVFNTGTFDSVCSAIVSFISNILKNPAAVLLLIGMSIVFYLLYKWK